MKRRHNATIALILFSLTLAISSAQAQQAAPFSATLRSAESSVYIAPSNAAQVVTSVQRDNAFEVVGRSLDGTWFEVRRPGRLTNLGWIQEGTLDWQFAPETLPLTDLTTGLTGAETLANDTGYAAYLLQDVVIRDVPLSTGQETIPVPFNVTLPILERNQDASWLRVNYLGDTGWVNAVYTRASDAMDIPLASGLPPLEGTSFVIVPEGLQLEQVGRLRSYLTVNRDLADGLAGLWWSVFLGEVMPCEPPSFVVEYLYNSQDVRQLPELARVAPQANEGIGYINESIDALYTCGVVNVEVATEARNDAINARVVFDAALAALNNVESIVRARR